MRPTAFRTSLVTLAVTSAFSALPGIANAGGFALIEQSGSGMGNAFSGAAAAAEDASTIYFNPAGMSLLPSGKHLAIAAHYVMPSAKFNNSASTSATLFGAPAPTGSGGDAGVAAWVPNGYFAMDLTDTMRLGVGVNVPFGLSTEYDSNWIGRFQGIKSEITTVNINPAISWKTSDTVSMGFGLNYQTIDAEFTSKSNYAAAVFAVAGAGPAAAIAAAGQAEGLTTLKGNDGAWGWNAGLMFTPSPQTRIGVSYRSRIKYTIEGTVQFDNRPALLAAAAPDGNIKLDVTMPDNLSFALSHRLDDRWQILADATWTGWSVLQKFEAVRTNNIPASGATLQNTPYNWRNTWRVGVGANYKLNEAWMLKGGIAYDQTPTNDTDRGVRLPDGNRTWLSIGAKYQVSNAGAVDFGYTHILVRDPSINNNAGGVSSNSTAAYALVNGKYDASVDILSVQYSHRF